MLEITTIERGSDMDLAFAIRREVFCREQGVSEAEEIDGLDASCRHYLARSGGAAIGTARVRSLADGEVKIERVAILAAHRCAGHGRALMAAAMADIAADGAPRIVINAQCRVEPFYAGLGFTTEGEVFDEAGIAHIRMVRAVR